MMDIAAPQGTHGFLYATTGEHYTALARRAARSLRQVMPQASIDLFTDQPLVDPVFDRIHLLTDSWFRPRMEAIRRSRFDRTVVLDADTVVLCDVSDLFHAVETAFLAATLATARPPEIYVRDHREIPRSFPYLNAGVLVVRNGPEIHEFCELWETMIRVGGHAKDQPSLRRLLHATGFPFQVLPPEYNVIYLRLLDIWEPVMGRPCILHIRTLHQSPPGDPTTPFDLSQVLGPRHLAKVTALMSATQPRKRPRKKRG